MMNNQIKRDARAAESKRDASLKVMRTSSSSSSSFGGGKTGLVARGRLVTGDAACTLQIDNFECLHE
eukprot:1122877-Amphidinium_carterae.1